jgi:hypothetical protein
MKASVLLAAGILMSTAVQAKDISILFIGNSMTASAGGQQELVPALLRTQGWTVKTADSYGPGMTLAGHWFNNLGLLDRAREDKIRQAEARREAAGAAYETAWENEFEKRETFVKRKGTLDASIAAQPKWNFVILQTGSSEPNDPDYYQTHEAATLLIEKIRAHSPEAKIIFYQPWPYNVTGEETPLYSAFRKEMVEKYNFYDFIPMMEAMLYARAQRPDLAIHRNPGNVHPGKDGGYLIACLLTCAVTGENPDGLPSSLAVSETYDHKSTEFTIAPDAAKFLQETAWKFYQERNRL